MIFRFACCTAFAVCLLGTTNTANAKRSHVVSAGDTLWDISRDYGCDVNALQKRNRLRGDRLDVGQELTIPACSDDRGSSKIALATSLSKESQRAEQGRDGNTAGRHVAYQIVSGDTLGAIAARHETSVQRIMAHNHLTGTTIYPGQSLEILPGSRGSEPEPIIVLGQSIGSPNSGRLRKPSKLKRGRGYFIRRPHRSYGAAHTIDYVSRAIRSVRRRFPKVHQLAVGDISSKRGGKISMHASHQTGRDIDLGFYFKRRPKGYPRSFVVATARNLHFDATWALLTAFTDLADRPGGVERIFMSYSTQRILYKLARKRGVSKKQLRRMFQYPRGRSSRRGIIHHEPGHNEHIHVRFHCPPGDRKCH